MAIPTYPLEVWAYQDTMLDTTQELNKAQPTKEQQATGWDFSQRIAVEHMNFELNMIANWLKYMHDEVVPGWDDRFLKVANNLAEIPDKAAARQNLGCLTIEEMDDRYVHLTGDTLKSTMTLGVTRINFKSADTDACAIYCSTIADTSGYKGRDKTCFDFRMADNYGTADLEASYYTGTEGFRYRFHPTGGSMFTLMKLCAISPNRGRLSVVGDIIAADNLRAGSMNGNTVDIWGTTSVSSQTLCGSLRTNSFNCDSHTTRSNYHVVGGRHVCRSVNGATADGNGNLTLTLPQPAISDVRCGGMLIDGTGDNRVRAGYVMRGWQNGNKKQLRGAGYWAAPLQKLVNGQWITVQTL